MIVQPTPENILEASDRLRSGGLVAFPTETVYGLGADATSDDAVARIFSVKRRPDFNPLIIHVSDIESAMSLAQLSDSAKKIASAFWPGPISIVAKKTVDSPISLLASAGLNTVAIRVPAHEITHALLRATARPVAAPSANLSGKISPTDALHVQESLGAAAEFIIDAGRCAVGLESTVIDCTRDIPTILRPGGVTTEQIEKVVGRIDIPNSRSVLPKSPGMLESHYAPDAVLRLNATSVFPGEALLAFGKGLPNNPELTKNLSPKANLEQAAGNLFAMLRELDALATRIAVMPVPNEGLGRAINDRLRRASAPQM